MIKSQLSWEDISPNLFTLSFPNKFESIYQEEQYKNSIQHTRIAILLSVFFFGIFGVLDAWMVPEAKKILWFIRYIVYCPYAIIIFLFSFHPKFKSLRQLCIGSIVAVAGLCIIAMILYVPSSNESSYYTGLILVFIFGYTFFKLDFVYATATGILIVFAYEFSAIWLTKTNIPILINNNFFILTGNLFGMFACYSIERYSRSAFLQAKLLEDEKVKVKAANSRLESEVNERTAQLMSSNKKLRKEIVERKRAEEKVRKSEEKYRNILESIEEGYYEFDIVGNLKFYNDGFKKIVGYNKTELHEVNYRLITEKDSINDILKAFNHVYGSHKSYKNIEWPIIRKDGAKRYLETSISLLKSEEGLPIGFQGIVRDVTDRNLAEASLIEAYQELKNTQSQLIQSGKLASIGELASGVAHELNQPLMVIRGNAQLIQKNINSERIVSLDIEKQVEPIVRNTKRMMNIINHLRTFSRQSKSEYYPISINKVVEDSFLMIEEQLRLRNIRVQKKLGNNLPDINGDSNQLEQVILNFLTNARDAITEKYSNNNNSGINADEIEIVTQISNSNKDYLEIIIRDSGNGIKREFQENIFDPFFTTKEVGKGTGLGLSISYGIIQEHKGQIKIANSGSEGTTFKIEIPISDTKKIKGSGEQISMVN